ncbi:MAG: hypothetical protein AB1491_11565 [Thermodesulfobacteriota bacterium]
MVVAPIVAQLAVPAAIHLVGKLISAAKQSQSQAEVQPPAPPDPSMLPQQAALTGKGANINLYA